jgi:SNF2 family DNA or RNA helicase
MASISAKSAGVSLARIGAYLRALAPFSGADVIPIRDFMTSLKDITPRQFDDDCETWGLDWTKETLDYSSLARAVRRELHRRKHQELSIELEPAKIPDPKPFLDSLGSDAPGARQAPIIEAAFDYGAARPQHFLSSHGDAERGQVGYRHQIEEALRIVEEMFANGLVVHEVGLGKTITGILVMMELLRRDPSMTCLILVPSNLRTQWKRELAKWSSLKITNEESGYAPDSLRLDPYLLLTIDTAKEERRARILQARRWGLLLVDEGHWLRNNDTARYRFVYSLRARFRLLLTATPVHNSGYDIFHQVNLVRPGYLGRKAVFAENFMRDERQINHAADLQSRLLVVVNQRQRHETDLVFPKRKIEDVEIGDRSDDERDLYNNVLSLLRGIYRWHLGGANFLRRSSGKEEAVSQLVLISMLVLRELASHPRAALKTMAGPLKKKVEKLASATGATADLKNLERKLAEIAVHYETEDWGAGKHQKTDRLLEELPALASRYGRVIVYVEFRETQKAIISRLAQIPKESLREHGLRRRPLTIAYHGGLSQGEKDWNLERLEKSEHAWFISTDAGGQGLNLQHGRVVVNFDFPWNPMRVEQRIGRVDRIGQKGKTVVIQNYITRGTIEEYVYRALREKLHVCEDVLGRVIPRIFQLAGVHAQFATTEDVLGIGQIILSSENEEDLRRKFRHFGADLDPEETAASKVWAPRKRKLDE